MIDACSLYAEKMAEINTKIENKIGMAASAYSTLATDFTASQTDFATTLDTVFASGTSTGLSDYYLDTFLDDEDDESLSLFGLGGKSDTSSLSTYAAAYTGSAGKLDAGSLESAIQSKSKTYNIDANLVKAVIKSESNFNSSAVSGAGAIGLMQLMPATAKALGVENPYDALQNMDGGIRYLKTQIDNFGGNVKMGLAAYNCGPSKLKSLNITDIDDPNQFAKLPKETQNYINKIMSYLK